jgi:ATP-dependent helicase/nuclease subunit B
MGGRAICEGVKKLLEKCGAPEKLDGLYEKFKDSFPVSAEFSKRVYGETLSVLDEAEGITGDNMPLGEVVKILKSGFSALEISLIPPKSDAVFVGDLSATSNIGSNVVFVAHLTGDVPAVGADTALLTDREIAELEKVNINISPKIRQVNLRARELCALNICAFRKELYLSYPVRLGGEESGVSEIISYAQTLLVTPAGTPIKAIDIKRLEKSERALAYYCSEKLPAIKRLNSNYRAEAVSAVYSVLSEHGYSAEADAVILPPKEKKISDGRALYVSYNSISPTMLETYFTCPYRSFMQQGLKLKERDEGVVRPVDSGNFIHTVLETLAPEVNTIEDEEKLKVRATEVATELLSKPPYSSLADSKSGAYTAEALKEEATEVSDGMFKQLKNSRFKVESAESKCDIPLKGGVKLYGRIDRVDSSGDMVRVVDYKTGTVDSSPTKYYMGLKLQLPIYLLYASKDRRAVGTYYFPASVEYKDEGKKDGVFRLQGFMDGSEEVVTASDITVEPKCKSEYIDAYLNGRRIDTAMPTEHFQYFLRYSTLIAEQGAREMLDGNITPSPVVDACKYCKVGGSCGFAVGLDGAERDHNSVKCEDIAEVVAKKEQEK